MNLSEYFLNSVFGMDRKRRGIRTSVHWIMAMILSFLVTSCTTIQPIPPVTESGLAWQQRYQRLLGQEIWRVRASVIGTTGKENFKARFLWKQSADKYEIQLFDPLGRVVAKITGSDDQVEVRTSKGEHYVDHDAQALIKKLFHLELPVNGLRYWALGIPHSRNTTAMVYVDERGLATSIVDSGWHIKYSDYRLHEGEALPQKFQLSYATTELKVSVGSWELL